jgi:hypothetical protein
MYDQIGRNFDQIFVQISPNFTTFLSKFHQIFHTISFKWVGRALQFDKRGFLRTSLKGQFFKRGLGANLEHQL